MILFTDYQAAAAIAFKAYSTLKEKGGGKYLLGMGVLLGAAPKSKVFVKCEAFQQVMHLAELNATTYRLSDGPDPAQNSYGLPILLSGNVQQWAQNEFATKHLSISGKPIYRLCEQLKQA